MRHAFHRTRNKAAISCGHHIGIHRLHPATANEILIDIRDLLGDELLERPRNGRIRLLGRYVKFPLNPIDLAVNLPPKFIAGFCRDTVTKHFRRKVGLQESFQTSLLAGLGETICHNFYFPYAKKLWGLNPQDISIIQAEKRVSANSLSKIIGKVFSMVPGIKQQGAGRFFYPVKGFGQISQSFATEVRRLGGKIMLSTKAEKIKCHNDRPDGILLRKLTNSNNGTQQKDSSLEELRVDFVFSTIPVTVLARILTSSSCRLLWVTMTF